MCDPEADYLEPPLQGFRLDGGVYRPVALLENGALPSRTLGLELCFDGHKLRYVDAETRQILLRYDELGDALECAEALAEAERKRANELAAELRRLRGEADEPSR